MIEQLARDNPDLSFIGIGSLDTLEEAIEFVDANGPISFPIVWDETGASWQALGVFGQPFWVFFDDRGIPVIGGAGGVDEALLGTLLP